MARKLKTYTTAAGFFELAVAAPSMKAALEAWGSNSNLFHHGLAKETDDSKIVAATMAKPGVVLRRPVGTNGAFTEQATLPSGFAAGLVGPPAAKRAQPRDKPAEKSQDKPRDVSPDKPAAEPVDERAAHKAALSFEREQERRRRQEQKEEAARAKARERRDRVIAAAEAALEDAGQAHRKKMDELGKARAALDRKLEAERERWRQEKEELDRALQDARS